MPTLTLPEGLTVELPEGEPVGAALPKSAIAVRVDGELRDLSFVPSHDAVVEPIDPRSDEGLQILRHSTAHVLAQAVCELYPGTRYAIGPAIADGFYYDFDIPEQVHAKDLATIDRTMRRIVKRNQPFVREEISRAEALERFADQPFKREIIGSGDVEGESVAGDTVAFLPGTEATPPDAMDIAVSPDEQFVYILDATNDVIIVYLVTPTGLIRLGQSPAASGSLGRAIAADPVDGQFIYCGLGDGNFVDIYDVQNGATFSRRPEFFNPLAGRPELAGVVGIGIQP